MRKLVVSTVLAVSMLAAAAPAAAQYYGGGYNDGYRGDFRGDYRDGYRGDYRGNDRFRNGYGIERQIDELRERVDRARDRRALSREEARRLRWEVDQLDRMADRARRDGLSPREASYLQMRVDRLRQQLRYERWD